MTTLMITPYPPYRDGIATYAVQEIKAMRAAGVDVEVMSPVPSAAHHHLVVGSVTGMTRLLAKAGAYDRLIIQFFPELMFGACRLRPERLMVWSLLEAVCRRTPTELRIHELAYADATIDAAMRHAARRALLASDRLTVHTEPERRQLIDTFDLPEAAVDLVDHGAAFSAKSTMSKQEARHELGLPADDHLFLSIGFIQRHKGFDRAVRAFQRAGLGSREVGAKIYVVGSVRIDHPDLVGYAAELTELCDQTVGAEFRQGFVGDEEFDRWLIAADTLVLPYREIWSSGVVERARLFGVSIITSAVGGLAHQIPDGSVSVSGDQALAAAMAQRAGAAATADVAIPSDRAELQRMISERAGTSTQIVAAGPIERVARLGHIAPTPPDSARPVVPAVKALIQRATGWQLTGIIEQLNSLQSATTEALEALDEPHDAS